MFVNYGLDLRGELRKIPITCWVERDFEIENRERESEISYEIFQRIYIAGDILVILAAVLYAIMFIKIRKWSKMTSDSSNNPEKYIFYQTLLILVTKLLAIIVIIIFYCEGTISSDHVKITRFAV